MSFVFVAKVNRKILFIVLNQKIKIKELRKNELDFGAIRHFFQAKSPVNL